ncbi:MAG: phosphoenolpyruvate synthase, partial [Ignavibacteriae bacterium]|nr:phosphoenolpyruvate synthase [Ignavibacteriota bacterium]
MFQPIELGGLSKYLKLLSKDSELKTKIETFINSKKDKNIRLSKNDFIELANFMWYFRSEMLNEKKTSARLALLDLSLITENILFTEINNWQPQTVKEIIEKNYYLAQTLVGTGNLEFWEWEKNKRYISIPKEDNIKFDLALQLNEASKRVIEWATNTIRANYNNDINLFAGFEPLANGFLDNKIRASILLYYGNEVSKLNTYITNKIGQKNNVLNLANQSQIKGLNPGYAKGELVVIKGNAEDIDFKTDKIYVFEKPLADLKPVAGLATVSEGNLVSHIQLLARNLGIPNAILSQQNLEDLSAFSGKKVFYAVSRKGKVLIKLESEMNDQEKSLFATKKEKNQMFEVPTDKLKLDVNNVIDLRNLKSKDSGVLCGPKAANLGQLKSMFPENVVEGFVLPFGSYKEHMEQMIPGKTITYWNFLSEIFTKKKAMQKNGIAEKEIDDFT